MNNKFSKKERDFFLRLKNPDPKSGFFKGALIIILFLVVMGLLYDANYGFHIIKNTKSIIGGLGGLIVLALIHVLGEGGFEWWLSKRKVKQPLYRRAFNLFVLLGSFSLAVCLFWFLLDKSDWWK